MKRQLIALALIIGGSFFMTTNATEKPPVPCAGDEYRQFDFWIGEWEVFDPSGKKVGENTIKSVLGGCSLQENWISTGANRGHSYNIYHYPTKQWHQTWVDNSGGLLQLNGGLEGKSMVLSGESISPNGKVQNRITWTPEKDKVRQVWDVSQDQGKNWQTIFNGLYKKKQK